MNSRLTAMLVVAAMLTLSGCLWETEEPQQACPEDAKICPDGTAVGRTGPNCDFASCPTETKKTLTEAEAQYLARMCPGTLKSGGTYNPNSRTWWFDITTPTYKEGCSPACVVSEDTRSAEINWRCTGLINPNIG